MLLSSDEIANLQSILGISHSLYLKDWRSKDSWWKRWRIRWSKWSSGEDHTANRVFWNPQGYRKKRPVGDKKWMFFCTCSSCAFWLVFRWFCWLCGKQTLQTASHRMSYQPASQTNGNLHQLDTFSVDFVFYHPRLHPAKEETPLFPCLPDVLLVLTPST